jgi:acyl-CoA thioester hydrolase
MPAIFDHHCTVAPEDIDGLGHVNNLVYLRWTQEAAIAHSAAQGWPPERYLEIGCGFVVRSHKIEFLRPALAGDEIIVRTWVADFRKAASLRKYYILRAADKKPLATAETDWVFVRLARGLPVRIPVEVSGAFQLVVSEPSGESRQ